MGSFHTCNLDLVSYTNKLALRLSSISQAESTPESHMCCQKRHKVRCLNLKASRIMENSPKEWIPHRSLAIKNLGSLGRIFNCQEYFPTLEILLLPDPPEAAPTELHIYTHYCLSPIGMPVPIDLTCPGHLGTCSLSGLSTTVPVKQALLAGLTLPLVQLGSL